MKKLAALLYVLIFVLSANATSPTRLTLDNTLFYIGDVSQMTNLPVLMQYAAMRDADKTKDIYLVIWSGGGEYTASVEASKIFVQDKHLHAIVIFAASGAAAISQNVGGKTYITKSGELMFHKAKSYIEGFATEKYLADILHNLTETNENFSKMCNRKMKLGNYNDRVAKDWYLSAKEAIKLNAADGIFSAKCDSKLFAENVTIPTFNPIHGSIKDINFCEVL